MAAAHRHHRRTGPARRRPRAGLGPNGARAGGEYGHERRWHRQGGAELPLDVQRGQRATGNDCRVGSRPRGLPCSPAWRDLSRP